MKMLFILLVAFIAASCVTAQSPPLPQPILPATTLQQPPLQQPSLPQPPPSISQQTVPATPSALTPGMVKTRLIVGKTNQMEVMEVFGPPDHVTKSGRGEMWGYDKVSREVAMAATGASAGANAGANVGASAGASAGGSVGLGGGALPFVAGAGGGVLGGALGGVGGFTGQNVGQNVGQSAHQSAAQSAAQSARQSQVIESTKTVFLLVYFSEEGIVTDYKLSATKF